MTVTQNAVSQSVLHLLTDYELHHSGVDSTDAPVAPTNPMTRPAALSQNPDWWPTNYRSVPDRRPINRELDRSLRPGGRHFMETWFIFTMLSGVTVMSVCITLVWSGLGNHCH